MKKLKFSSSLYSLIYLGKNCILFTFVLWGVALQLPVKVYASNLPLDSVCSDPVIIREPDQLILYGVNVSNQGDKPATFEIRMNQNKIFGAAQTLWRGHELLPGMGEKLSEPLMLQVPRDTKPQADNVIISEWMITSAGETQTKQCSFDLLVVLPKSLQNLIQVPVRFCVLEGSQDAQGSKAGALADPSRFMVRIRAVNRIWVPQAGILFHLAHSPGIPVISVPGAGDRTGGDTPAWIDQTQGEANILETECQQQWKSLAPEERGIIVLHVGTIYDYKPEYGFTTPIPDEFLVTFSKWDENQQKYVPSPGNRRQALCRYPRKLLMTDVSTRYVTMEEGNYREEVMIHTLAHEFGHVFLLGHGDGLDNNHDGLEPPNPGVRGFDICDPVDGSYASNYDGEPLEDKGSTTVSLMHHEDYSSEMITELQTEQARAAAKQFPGAIYKGAPDDPSGIVIAEQPCFKLPCKASPDILIVEAALDETPTAGLITFKHVLSGPLDDLGVPLTPGAINQYMMFVDLDNNLATGCVPSEAGFPTSFVGAEIITQVSLRKLNHEANIEAKVWRCEAGKFVLIEDPEISANAHNRFNDISTTFSEVYLTMPTKALMPVAMGLSSSSNFNLNTDNLRIQVFTQVVNGDSDRLPEDPSGGVAISLQPRVEQPCEISPLIARPGDSISVQASMLSPGTLVDVFIDKENFGQSMSSDHGDVNFQTTLPTTISEGVHGVSVEVHGAAISSSCGLLVQYDKTVNVDYLPVSNAGGPYATSEGVDVLLDASKSTPGLQGPLTFEWDMDNDGFFDDITGQNPPFIQVGHSGVLTVRLRSKNQIGMNEDTTTVTVNNVPPLVNLTADPSKNEGDIVAVNGKIVDPGWLESLRATIDWGDGSPVEAVKGLLENLRPNATLTFNSSHIYADNGSYTIQVCGTDDSNTTTCSSSVASMNNIPPVVKAGSDKIIYEGSTFILDSATFNDKGTLDTHSATINWGDGSPSTSATISETLFGPPGSPKGLAGIVLAQHQYSVLSGIYTVTVTVTDKDGGVGSDVLKVTVIPPVIVGDKVWSDTNYNGRQDDEEPGVPNVKVSLYDAITKQPVLVNGQPLTKITDDNGIYLFNNLPLGNYYVVFDLTTLPKDYKPTQQNEVGVDDTKNSDSDQITGQTRETGLLQSGSSDLNLDMGIIVPTALDVIDEPKNKNTTYLPIVSR